MKLSTTFFFILLFILVLVAFLKIRPLSNEGEPVPVEAEVLKEPKDVSLIPMDSEEDFKWIQVQNLQKNEIITVVRRGEDWWIKYPVLDYANAKIVSNMIHRLMEAEKKQEFTPEKDWEEYGLLRPETKVGIETHGGADRRYLFLGDVSPVNRLIFARWHDEDKYFLLEPELKEAFRFSLYKLREKKIFFTLDKRDVTKILFRTETTTYQVALHQGVWKWERPESLKDKEIQEQQINPLVDQIDTFYIKDFIDSDETMSADELGLNDKGNYLKIWGEGFQSKSLYLGSEAPLRHAYYAKREGDEQLFIVERDKVRELFQTVQTLANNSEAALVET